MSLDIYIISPEPIKKKSTGIFARIDGQTRELTKEEVIERFPDVDPHDIVESAFETDEFWHGNITHNFREMAKNCKVHNWPLDVNLYDQLWRDESPDKEDIGDYKVYLILCLNELESNPDKYKQYNPSNGWGTYEQLVEFIRSFIHALIDMPPGSTIEYSR